MMKMNYLAACIVAVTALPASAFVDVSGGANGHDSTISWKIEGTPKIQWQAKGHRADLDKIDLSKFPSANAGSMVLAAPKTLFSLAMTKAGAPKDLFNVPQIEYRDSAGQVLAMSWDATNQEGTLSVPGKMEAGGQSFTVAMKVAPVSLARIADQAQASYLDVAVKQDSAHSSLFKGLACTDCTLPVLTDRTLAPELLDRIHEFDVSSHQQDANQDTAVATLNTTTLGDKATDAAELVSGGDKQYTVANSEVMLGAGLVLKAGTISFTSPQGFTAGKWTAPITVVVTGL